MTHAAVVWFTGLPAAGKTAVASAVAAELAARGHRVARLDGDELRRGLCRDLGFSLADRAENVRRAGEVARMFVDAGVLTLCALVSPLRADRAAVRARFAPGRFVEVFVDTPLAVCEARDPKGLYARARAGALRDVTGIDSPYEAPLGAELVLAGGAGAPVDALAAQVLARLAAAGVLGAP